MQNRSWSAEEGGPDVAWPPVLNTTFWPYENESVYDEYGKNFDRWLCDYYYTGRICRLESAIFRHHDRWHRFTWHYAIYFI